MRDDVGPIDWEGGEMSVGIFGPGSELTATFEMDCDINELRAKWDPSS